MYRAKDEDDITFTSYGEHDFEFEPTLVSEILQFQKDWLIKPDDSIHPDGFLISRFESDELTGLLKAGAILHIARSEKRLAGYILITDIH